MLLTRECDYALRIIRELADLELHTVTAICNVESVPGKFAYKILKKLERASLVKSFRGKTGGYRLIKPPGDITLYEVVLVIDGDIFLNTCLKDGESCSNRTSEKECLFHEEFRRMQEQLIRALSEKTVGEILKIQCKN